MRLYCSYETFKKVTLKFGTEIFSLPKKFAQIHFSILNVGALETNLQLALSEIHIQSMKRTKYS